MPLTKQFVFSTVSNIISSCLIVDTCGLLVVAAYVVGKGCVTTGRAHLSLAANPSLHRKYSLTLSICSLGDKIRKRAVKVKPAYSGLALHS